MRQKKNVMAASEIAKEPIWRPIVKDDPSVREVVPTDDGEKLSFWQQLQVTFGVRSIDMANHPNTPPSMPLNVTTIGTWVVIIAAVLGGFWWSWQQGQAAGYDKGRQETINQQLNERLQKAEQDAAEAKKLQTYSAGVADTHNQKEQKK